VKKKEDVHRMAGSEQGVRALSLVKKGAGKEWMVFVSESSPQREQ